MNTENAIEWYTNDKKVTLSLTQKRFINRIKELYSKYKDEFYFFHENDDGSLCVTIPIEWLYINHPRIISEEQKEKMVERLRGSHV